MALSTKAKKRFEVAMARRVEADEILTAIDSAPNSAAAASASASAASASAAAASASAAAAKNLSVAFQPAANPYTIVAANQLVVMNIDNQVGNLPAATGSGRVITFLAQAPSTVLNIYPHGSDQIDALGAGTQLQIWIASPNGKLVDVAPGQWLSII